PVISNAQSAASGIYTLIAIDANGCGNSDTVNVNINQTPFLSGSNGGLTCTGQSITLSANFGAGTAVNWFSDAFGNNPTATNTFTYSPLLTTSGTYTYYAQGSVNGCTSAITPVVANYYNVVASYSATPVSGMAPLTVQFTNLSTGISLSDPTNWTFGDGNSSGTYNPGNVYQGTGTYTVMLIVSNGLCSDTATGEIKVFPAIVEVPEVFTPNGDGKNDVFEIKNIEYFPNNELIVFNRWGNVIYTMKGYSNEWNGTSNVNDKTGGGRLPTGTYYYLLKLNDGENQVFRGFCQLLY
ncbi:MAG: hypothetical protein JWO32_472, partial [Bacteroidetes bacterium]|nr:hypothetical protein [Bacteroidota bacterium]